MKLPPFPGELVRYLVERPFATERKQADDRQILDRIMRSETGKQFQKAIEETKGGSHD